MKKWTTYAGHCKHGRVQMVGRHIGKQKQVEFNGFYTAAEKKVCYIIWKHMWLLFTLAKVCGIRKYIIYLHNVVTQHKKKLIFRARKKITDVLVNCAQDNLLRYGIRFCFKP